MEHARRTVALVSRSGGERSEHSLAAVMLNVAVAAALVFVLVSPYYLLGHIFLPRLRRCEYGYEDFQILPHPEAWLSYLVSPVVAGVLTYALIRICGWKRLWPVAFLVPIAVAVELGLYTGGANCGD